MPGGDMRVEKRRDGIHQIIARTYENNPKETVLMQVSTWVRSTVSTGWRLCGSSTPSNAGWITGR